MAYLLLMRFCPFSPILLFKLPYLGATEQLPKKFHLTNCMTTLMIESENREYSTLSPEELMNKGFKPCKQCNPERNR